MNILFIPRIKVSFLPRLLVNLPRFTGFVLHFRMRASCSLFPGTPGERAGERGGRRVDFGRADASTLLERSLLFVSTCTLLLSPTLSPEYREEGVNARGTCARDVSVFPVVLRVFDQGRAI